MPEPTGAPFTSPAARLRRGCPKDPARLRRGCPKDPGRRLTVRTPR